MFNDEELDQLYAELKVLKGGQEVIPPKATNDSVDELKNALAILDMEETEGNMSNDDMIEEHNSILDQEKLKSVNNRFIGKAVKPEGIFSNIKTEIRQSNKKRIERYANTTARVVKESNVEPLKLARYTT